MNPGSRVRDIRNRIGLTQEELAEVSGVSVATIRRVELGEVRPRRLTRRRLAQGLGVSLELLWPQNVRGGR